MKVILGILSVLTTTLALQAQTPARPDSNTPPPAAATANPVVWSSKQVYDRQAKYLIAAAEEMPDSKYIYKPTADQWTFARIVSHVAQSNGGVCSALSDTPAPAATKVPETATKAELVAALKASIDYCDPIMANLTDAKLADVVSFHGGKVPRARALIEIVADLEDHYSQMASYLRLNSMMPPSAAPKK